MDKITIIGMGLIGTSLGMAIKGAGIKNAQIVGMDINRGHSSRAQKMGAIDRAENNLARAAEDAEIVIIATPVMAMKDVMQAIGPHLTDSCRLVTDTGDTKGVVLEWADEYLPRRVSFVGGHPVVGKLTTGPDEADGTLFHDHPYAVIPSRNARQDAVRLLTDLIRGIGARPYFVDIGEHDSFVSAVNHLPYLISMALVACTSSSPSWDDIAKIATAQYGTLTSLASGEVSSHKDKFFGNDASIVYWIDAFVEELQRMRRILASDEDARLEALEGVFIRAIRARDRWVAGVVTPASQAAMNKERIPSAYEGVSQLFLGDTDARRRVFGRGGRSGKDSKDRT